MDAREVIAKAGKQPVFKFTDPDDSITGTIAGVQASQETEYGTRELKFDRNGDPVWQLVVTLTPDDGDRGQRVYVRSGRMLSAVQRAVYAAGAETLQVGGELTLTYVGDDTTADGYRAKDFAATYEPPDPDVIGTGELGETELELGLLTDTPDEPPF